MKRRLFSLFLALVMCLSLLPTAAFAEDVTTDGDTTGSAITTDTPADEGKDESSSTDATGAPADKGEADSGEAGDGEDADRDGDSTDSPAAPVVQSMGTPVAPALLGGTNQESYHTSPGHKDCGRATCTKVGHTCSSDSVSWIPISTAQDLISADKVTGDKHFYLTKDIEIGDILEIKVNNVVLCLNGHTITLNKNGPVIEVSSGKTFTLTDCGTTPGTITHNDKTGCGVLVRGTFNMYGGNITGNIGDDGGNKGGGVYVVGGGTFNMCGGTITDNRGVYSGELSYGGGVYIGIAPVGAGGTFNMYGGTIGGTITGNSADYGGGVYMEYAIDSDYPATFKMYGGTITGNSADYGGGVFVDNKGAFTMSGGSITQNEAEENGGGVYVRTDSITVGGSARITDNKSVGITTAGKEDNVYLALNTKVSMNNGFSGSVGINVDVNMWKTTPNGETVSHGKSWVAVDGDGRNNAISGNQITYDSGEFTIDKNTGKLSCLHVCEATESGGYYHCDRCNEIVIIKTDFKNSAGNIIKTQYYETASAAFDKAENNCVITMLTAAEFGSYTWNLEKKTVTLNADYVLKKLTVNNGTLNLGYTRDSDAYYIENMAVGSGATVNVDVQKLGFYGNPSLTVESGGKVVFKSGNVDDLKVENGGKMAISGGTFGSITVADGMTCADLLANGYAYFSGDTLVSGSETTLSDVTVKGGHSCSFTADNNGVCTCGRKCPHSSIDIDTGKCSACNAPMTGVLVQKTAGGTTGTQKFATFNEAVNSIESSDTNVTIKLMADAELVDTDPAMEDDNTTILFPCTIDLNGKKLTVKESYGNNIEECNLTIASTVTITGTDTSTAGTIDTGVSVFYYKDAEEGETKGILTVTGNVSIPKLWVNDGATVNLKGGTYGNVSGDCTAGDLLAEGYAFQQTGSSGAFVKYSTNISPFGGTPLTNVKVVECKSHSIVTGGKCDWCGTQFAVERTIKRGSEGSTTTTTEYFATLSEAMTGIEDDGSVTIKLLADVTEKSGAANKQIKIEKNIYLTLDLGGHTLTADVKLAMTADSAYLHMSSSGTLAGTLAVNGGTVELSGGTFNEIKVEPGKTVRGLLATDYGYQYTTGENNGTWPTGDEQTIQNVSVKKIPITGVSVPHGGSYPYGNTTSLTATPSGVAEGAAVTYQWYMKQGSNAAEKVGTNNTYTTPADLAVGEYDIFCEATVDGYSVMSDNVSVTVKKITLNNSTYSPTAKDNLAIKIGADGAAVAQVLVNEPSMPDGCYLWYRLGEDGEFTTTVPTATNAGTYTVYWYSTGNDIYEGAASEREPKKLTVTIAQKAIGSGDITATDGTYTGEPIRATITVKDGDVTLKEGTHYTVSGEREKTDAGTYSVTITGKGNYSGTQTVQWTIGHKTLTLTPDTYTVYAKKGTAPTADLAQIAKTLGMPDNDGELEFYGSDDRSISALPAANETTTLTLTVRSKNHQATIQIKIEVSDKTVPTVSVSDYNKPYSGEEVTAATVAENAAVTADGVTGEIRGVWSWTNGKAPKTVTDSGMYLLTFTPTDSDSYSAVTTTVQVTITRKTVTLSNLAAWKEYDGTAAVNQLRLSLSDSTLVLGTDYTITASFDNANAGTGKTVTATVKLSDSAAENYCFVGSGGASVKEVTITGTNGYIAQKKLTIGGVNAASKYYDGTVAVDDYGAALVGFVEDESNRPKRGTDYTISAAFDSANAGMGKTVTITVTLQNTAKAANYYFEVDGSASRTIQVETTADIHRLPLKTMPTVKESVVKLTQDVFVRSGSYPLFGNVNVVLPEGVTIDLEGELHFALGKLPAKVTAQIDEGGMLSYTINGGKAGDKLAIPVTVTMPNLAYYEEQGGAAAVALGNEPDGQTPEIDPNAGTITLSFTVQVELTGRSQQVTDNDLFEPIRRPTGGGGNSGSGNGGTSDNGGTSGNGGASGSAGTSGGAGSTGSAGATGSGVASPGTGDAGVAVYAMLSLSAALGCCATGCVVFSRRRRRG